MTTKELLEQFSERAVDPNTFQPLLRRPSDKALLRLEKLQDLCSAKGIITGKPYGEYKCYDLLVEDVQSCIEY